jgi:tetratricopeptide (TPR) repeat protein
MHGKNFLNAILAMPLLFTTAIFADGGAGEAIQRGNEAFGRGHYQLAIFEYQAALAVDSRQHYVMARYNIGVCYFKLGRLSDAVREYRAAIAAGDGQYSKALYALGVALEDLGQWDEATSALTRAVEVSGGRHVEALFELGLIRHREGDFEAASDHFRRAVVQVSGIFPAGFNNLGVALAALGRLSEAEQAFEKAFAQSKGRLVEARRNLRLCRSSRSSPFRERLASLTIAGRNAAAGN